MDVIIHVKCVPNLILVGKRFYKENALKTFKNVLDKIVPKYGKPQINLEGSGEPTMAGSARIYQRGKKRGLKCLCTAMVLD